MFSIVIIFILGYVVIAFEQKLAINKAATALIMAVLCWTIYILFADSKELVTHQLTIHLGKLSQILFFLLGAMTIVELIDAHDGFEIITQKITTANKRRLLWVISFFTFFLSAVLDNLTTTIVMISITRKLMKEQNDRRFMTGMIIIAANAGGAWSPIGDVTTTMLWIGGQVTTFNIVIKLFIPSLVGLLIPLFIIQRHFKGSGARSEILDEKEDPKRKNKYRNSIFYTGVAILLMVPVFKVITHLPPFMAMLMGLGIIWVFIEIMERSTDTADKNFTVISALKKIDSPGILFFLGILLAVAALQSAGYLTEVALWLNEHVKNQNAIILGFGSLSAVVDNVPLVAAATGMYNFPTDHYFWEFLAYAAGTGGSLLIIGSAAGIAATGIEKIDFFWYLKKISWVAFAGFMGGAIVYFLQSRFLF